MTISFSSPSGQTPRSGAVEHPLRPAPAGLNLRAPSKDNGVFSHGVDHAPWPRGLRIADPVSTLIWWLVDASDYRRFARKRRAGRRKTP